MRYSIPARSISYTTAGSWAHTAIAVCLGLLAGVTRLAWVRSTPINWDAVQFALALDRFDLHNHQPHPPGYILYVALGRAANAMVGDPNISLALLSVLFSVAATVLLYRLALVIFEDHAVALGASLLAIASPLALYYGSVGLTYVPEMAFSIAVAGLAWRLRFTHSTMDAVWLGIALGISGGIRQTSLVVLLPLCAWALWKQPRERWAAFLVALAATCMAWLVPLLWLSGGPGAYLHESALLAAAASQETAVTSAGIEGLLYNVTFEGLALGLGLAFAVIPLGLWALRVVRFSLSRDVKLFVAWWALPPVILYSVSHVGQYGYLLVVLPPLLLVAALSARVLVERLKNSVDGKRAAIILCSALAALSGAYFLLAQGPITAESITANDAHWTVLRATLSRFDPSDTVLVSSDKWEGAFRQGGYLLPAFHLYAEGKGGDKAIGWLYSAYGGHSNYSLPHPPAQVCLSLPPGTRNVVALDDETAQLLTSGKQSLQTVSLADGSSLYMLTSRLASLPALVARKDGIEPVGGCSAAK